MHYKISDFTKISGVKASSLRFFEQNGLIAPERSENGYRLYSLRDSYRINTFNMLTALGYTVSQAAARTECISPDQFTQELTDNIERMEQEKALLEKRIEWAKTLRMIYSNEDRYLLKPFIRKLPNLSLLVCVIDYDLSPSIRIGNLISDMVELLPFTQYAGISGRNIPDRLGMIGETDVLNGFGIDTQDMYNLAEGEYVILMSNGTDTYNDIENLPCIRQFFPHGLPDECFNVYLMVETPDSLARCFWLIPHEKSDTNNMQEFCAQVCK